MQTVKLSPGTPLINMGDLTLGDFWSWAYSDLISNGNRSVFAEFIVGTALGATQAPRREWDAVDLRYDDKTIEVKASAYTQSWAPAARPSPIQFDIGKKLGWDWETGASGAIPVRTADCYVFCLHTERERERALECILDVETWAFYVVATEQLEQRFKAQKTLSLSVLAGFCAPVGYTQLKDAVDTSLANASHDKR